VPEALICYVQAGRCTRALLDLAYLRPDLRDLDQILSKLLTVHRNQRTLGPRGPCEHPVDLVSQRRVGLQSFKPRSPQNALGVPEDDERVDGFQVPADLDGIQNHLESDPFARNIICPEAPQPTVHIGDLYQKTSEGCWKMFSEALIPLCLEILVRRRGVP